MNLLMITDKLLTGGAETYFCKLENNMDSFGITVYTAAAMGELYERLRHKEHFFALSRTNHKNNINLLKRIVLELQIDIMHANSLRMALYAIVVKRMVKRKLHIVYTKHNVTMLETKVPWLFTKIVNRCIDQVITVSDYEKQQLLRLGVQSSIIHTIYNGVDLQQFSFSKKQNSSIKKIGILARLSEEKNHGLFLKIAKELAHEPNLSFYIAGDGPEHEHIQALCKKLHLEDRVHLLGEVKQPEEFIKSMDLLLLTSKREVFPMVILEAMAIGTPVLSINIGGIKEAIIDRQTGFLASRHEEKQFVRQIQDLRFDNDMRTKVIQEARRKVEQHFTLERMASTTADIYKAVHSKAHKRDQV